MASTTEPPERAPEQRLGKTLGLLDVYAISTGAMFSSGFFLLPGLASAEAGPAVALAYLLAGVLVLPAMLSAAELSTAMPRAGGPYYFLDRSMGPLVGTIAGIGTWTALVFKTAFALVGMSAYIALFADLPIQPIAAGLTLVFLGLNIVGVKKTSVLQVGLVAVLVLVLGYFLVEGIAEVVRLGPAQVGAQFAPFLPFGFEGLLTTTGLVFVSYAGLTQVASVSEEVRDAGRNIPLGMMLSLLTATVVYVLGVAVMVAVLDPAVLRDDLAPVATAARAFMPMPLGLVLVIGAAVAAFASTGNAGMLAAARYPLAMARDRLLWRRFAVVGRFETPTGAIVVTAAAILLFILLLDVEEIAKLASAFMLLIFGLLNLAVIVMRESRIDAYDPGFRSPLYPWTQIAGLAGTVLLIVEIGVLSVVFTVGLTALCLVWYWWYARHQVSRDGAIYHIFERLGRRRDTGLDRELTDLLQEQGVRDDDRFDEVVARSRIMHVEDRIDYAEAVDRGARMLAERADVDVHRIVGELTELGERASRPISPGVAMPYALIDDIERTDLAIVSSAGGIRIDHGEQGTAFAVFFLIGPAGRPGQLLRVVGQLATHVGDEAFLHAWGRAREERDFKAALLEEQRLVSLRIHPDAPSGALAGRSLRDIDFPDGCLVATIRRDAHTMVPRGGTVLRSGDRITVIGDPPALRELVDRYADA